LILRERPSERQKLPQLHGGQDNQGQRAHNEHYTDDQVEKRERPVENFHHWLLAGTSWVEMFEMKTGDR